MDEHTYPIRGRMVSAIRTEHGFDSITLTEDRRSDWTKLAVAWLFCSLIVLAVGLWMHDEPEMTAVTAFAILFGVPLLIATLLIYPWNVKVTVDTRDGYVTRTRRFFIVPFLSRSFSLWHGQLTVASAVHSRYDTVEREDSHSSLGCLTLAFGPLGALLAGFAILGSIERIRSKAWVVVYEPEFARPRILIKCKYLTPLAPLEDFLRNSNQAT